MLAKEGEEWGVTANGHGVSFWGDGNVFWNQTVGMAAQHWTY